MQFVLVLALLVSIGAIIFAAQNGAPVTVQLFAWSFKSSLALVLVLTFLLGVLTSLMVSIPASILRRRRRQRKARQQMEQQALPLEPEPSGEEQ